MASTTITDHAMWFKHIHDKTIVSRLSDLPENAPVRLKIDGEPILFRRMRNGTDGRPTPGVRPDEAFRAYWNRLYQDRRGQKVSLEIDEQPGDPYLAGIGALAVEWSSDADAAAYDDL